MSEREQPDRAPAGGSLGAAVDAVPGLARLSASAAWHTTGWGVRTSVRTSSRIVRAIGDRDEAEALTRDAAQAAVALSAFARSVSSGTPLARALHSASSAISELTPLSERRAAHLSRRDGGTVAEGEDEHGDDPGGAGRSSRSDPEPSLRERGSRLLERSRDVWGHEQAHPAYARILDELAPDEGRILVLLLTGGPQPSVDVRTGGPIGMVNSQLIAPGLSMVGARAGVRYGDHVPAYLNNLFRLGLVWFSREALRDPMPYQVVEAQPDVLAAVHSVTFAKVVRRSIHLTPFGEDFCRTCLVDQDAAVEDYPAHLMPPEVTERTQRASGPPS